MRASRRKITSILPMWLQAMADVTDRKRKLKTNYFRLPERHQGGERFSKPGGGEKTGTIQFFLYR